MDLLRETAETVADVFHYLEERFNKGRTDRTLVYQFIVEDETWAMTISPESCLIESGLPVAAADCTLTTSKELFLNTFNRDYTPSMMDLLNGKIKCDRPELLLTLKRVFGDS